MFLGLIVAIMAMAGCAGGAKPVKNPTESPAESSSLLSLDQALKEASNRIDERITAGSKIAPLNFNSPHDKFSDYVLEELTANLVESRKLTVVDRREIDLIRNEFDFQFSGDVGDDSMQQIGQMLGAQAIISGNFTDMGGFIRIMIRVLNVQNASVEVQYRANIVSDAVTMALLTGGRRNVAAVAPRQATSGGSTATQTPTTTAQTQTQVQSYTAQTANPTIAIEVTVKSGGKLYFQDKEVATLWDNDSYTIPIDGPGTYTLKMVFADHTETRSVTITSRGITKVSLGSVYTVGSIGPASGIIFYDKGSYSEGWRYLEAHTADFTGVQWGANGTAIGGTMAGLGDGKRNTELIIGRLNRSGEENRAAQLAAILKIGGFTDWYLPSRDELDLMYKNLKQRERGNFSDVWYWSSSESDSSRSWVQHFGDGRQTTDAYGARSKAASHSARAIRRF